MRRREFITLLGGAAAAWPLAAHAQQRATPVIGYLGDGSSGDSTDLAAAFRQGLSETGFVEGRNVTIEYNWTEGNNDRMPAMAAELVRHSVAVIVAFGGVRSALAAKAVTATIPIVFLTGGDPVKLGLVASLNRPGGNLTGVTTLGNALISKELQLLRELLPTVDTIAFLVNPTNPTADPDIRDAHTAARLLGQQILVLNASTPSDIDAAFATLAQSRIGALVIEVDGLFNNGVDQIVALTAHHAIPAVHARRQFAAAGGLMSYGTASADMYRQVGVYSGRILKGEKPTDLPVQQSTRFELVLNLKTAKGLGLTIPPGVLAIADEVIE